MRAKHIFARVPVPAKLRLFWDRVTISKITTIYFIFSVLHCLIQIIFQVQAFTINAKAANFLSDIIAQGNETSNGFAVFGGQDLQWCTSVPANGDTSSCRVIWNGTVANAAAAGGMALNSSLPRGSAAADHAAPTSSDEEPSTTSIPAQSTASAASIAPISAAVISPSASVATPAVVSPASVSSLSASSAVTSLPVSPSVVSPSILTSAQTSSGTSLSASLSSATPSVSQSPDESASTTLITVTVAPSAFSREPGVAAPSDSVTRTFTVVLNEAAAITRSGFSAPAATTTEVSSSAATSSSVSRSATASAKVTPTAASFSIDHQVDEHIPVLKRDAKPEVVGAVSSTGENEVVVNDFFGKSQITLDDKCLLALNWPNSQVKNTKREDIVFICFQIWVLGMSIVALLNESIPHIFASLLTHIIATAWGGFQIFNTQQFRADFVRLTTNGACGVNLLPTYWKARANAEIPSLALNCAALLVSMFLSWRLIKLFGWQTFKRVGASLTINRVYNAVLVLSITIQLTGFFIAVSGGLWIDQVFNGPIGKLSANANFFKGMMVVVLVLLFPWLATGWISVRRELKVTMLVFLVFSLLYLVGWSAMFASDTFRLTFLQWRFFSLMTSASVFLTAVTFVVGVFCRVNFGKGLRRHLEAQEVLQDDDYEKGTFEKVAFPDSSAPIPTFSAAFVSGPEVPPPSQMNFAPRIVGGPRFYGAYDAYGAPMDTYTVLPYNNMPYTAPRTPSPTHSTKFSERGLSRSGSGSSQHSTNSDESLSSAGHSSRSKRWIIE